MGKRNKGRKVGKGQKYKEKAIKPSDTNGSIPSANAQLRKVKYVCLIFHSAN